MTGGVVTGGGVVIGVGVGGAGTATGGVGAGTAIGGVGVVPGVGGTAIALAPITDAKISIPIFIYDDFILNPLVNRMEA